MIFSTKFAYIHFAPAAKIDSRLIGQLAELHERLTDVVEMIGGCYSFQVGYRNRKANI